MFIVRNCSSIYTYRRKRSSNNNSAGSSGTDNTRFLALSSSCRTTQALARYLSVLQMIYEAIAYRIMLTKRDMYYRNVELFGKQSVVDIVIYCCFCF